MLGWFESLRPQSTIHSTCGSHGLDLKLTYSELLIVLNLTWCDLIGKQFRSSCNGPSLFITKEIIKIGTSMKKIKHKLIIHKAVKNFKKSSAAQRMFLMSQAQVRFPPIGPLS